MSVVNHQIRCLLIMLTQLKIVPYVWISFVVICRVEWEGVGRISDRVKILKELRAYFITAINSQIILL